MHRKLISTIALLLCWTGQTLAQVPQTSAPKQIKCSKTEGYIGGPFVSTRQAARQIFLAVAREIAPDKVKQYPVVTITDAGDHWEVSQATQPSTDPAPPNSISVDAGGGGVYMRIEKCSGA